MNRLFASIALLGLLVAMPVFYRSCVPHKMDEAIFYKDTYMELKVARYFENLPLHYTGPVYSIGCKSNHADYKTAPAAWHKLQDAGWTEITVHPGVVGLGWDPALQTLATAARQGYWVTDAHTLIYPTLDNGINVSWDACASFRHWGIKDIPAEWLNMNITPENVQAQFSDITAHHSGTAAFNVALFIKDSPPSTKAPTTTAPTTTATTATAEMPATHSFTVSTHDFGKTWQIQSGVADKAATLP